MMDSNSSSSPLFNDPGFATDNRDLGHPTIAPPLSSDKAVALPLTTEYKTISLISTHSPDMAPSKFALTH